MRAVPPWPARPRPIPSRRLRHPPRHARPARRRGRWSPAPSRSWRRYGSGHRLVLDHVHLDDGRAVLQLVPGPHGPAARAALGSADGLAEGDRRRGRGHALVLAVRLVAAPGEGRAAATRVRAPTVATIETRPRRMARLLAGCCAPTSGPGAAPPRPPRPGRRKGSRRTGTSDRPPSARGRPPVQRCGSGRAGSRPPPRRLGGSAEPSCPGPAPPSPGPDWLPVPHVIGVGAAATAPTAAPGTPGAAVAGLAVGPTVARLAAIADAPVPASGVAAASAPGEDDAARRGRRGAGRRRGRQLARPHGPAPSRGVPRPPRDSDVRGTRRRRSEAPCLPAHGHAIPRCRPARGGGRASRPRRRRERRTRRSGRTADTAPWCSTPSREFALPFRPVSPA